MSYREIKGFIEKMCILGYPRLISRDNFRSPNFHLVAEIIHWFCQRIDHSNGIQLVIDSQQERLIFITSAVQFLNNKLHLKLNAKRLYQGDNMAVRELLRVADVLSNALKIVNNNSEGIESDLDYVANEQTDDIKDMRRLASEMTSKGALIYDFLGKDRKLYTQRSHVLQKNYEIVQVEAALQKKMAYMDEKITYMQQAIDSIATTEASLDQKIEKKTGELQRLTKRLDTLKNIRPPFVDEFERLEAQLRLCYEEYVNKFRCQSYLDQQWQELERSEQQQLEERQATARKMAERLRQEETLQALEAAVGGTWEGGNDFDISPEGSLENFVENPNITANRPRLGSLRFAGAKKGSAPVELNSDSDSDLDDGGGLEDKIDNYDSDATVDEWHSEVKTWQVGTRSSKRDKLIKPTPAHISDDDF